MCRRMPFVAVSLGAMVLLLCGLAGAQTYDAQSAVVIATAGLALGPGQPVNDIVLTGTATHFDGVKTDSGTAIVKIKGTEESRIDLALSSAARSEVRGLAGRTPKGAWNIGTQPAQHQPLHNMLTPACWASPVAVLAALVRPGSNVGYVGQEQRFGVTVDHLRANYVPPTIKLANANTVALVQRLSAYDLYVDATSHLPLSVAFNIHADNDLNIDIPVEVQFSNYNKVNGVMVPFRIQRLFRKTVNLDFTVTAATLNSGLSDSDFTVQ